MSAEELKMKITNRGVRGVATLTGVAVATSAFVPMQAAQATDKEKAYKTGAIALGALGAVLAVKGKTLPAVVAGAGAYYAYKKSKDADNDRTAGDVYPDSTRTTRRSDGVRSGSTFPQNRRTEGRRTESTRNDDVYAEDGYADNYPTEDYSVEDRSGDDVFYADNYPNDPGYVGLSQKSGNAKTKIVLK